MRYGANMPIRKFLSLAPLTIVALCLLFAGPTSAQTNPGMVYELRTYTSTPGNLDKLLTRFRDHTMRIFEKHGMTNIGYWIPVDEAESGNTLIYILAHDSMEAAARSWQAFGADPEWQKVNDESNANGLILQSVVRKYLSATDFSPMQ